MAVGNVILLMVKFLVASGFVLSCVALLLAIAIDSILQLDDWFVFGLIYDTGNFIIWLRSLPGRWFVRATHDLNSFSASYIRPTAYALNNSVKEGKVNTFVHTMMRTKKKTCPICSNRRFKHVFHHLSDCGHEACAACIREYVDEQINAGRTDFKCPLGNDCGDITVRVVEKASRVDMDLRDKVERMQVRVALAGCVDAFRCPSTGCGNAVFSDTKIEEAAYLLEARLLSLTVTSAFATDLGGSDLRKFKCVTCGYSYCVLCSWAWNQGKFCSD